MAVLAFMWFLGVESWNEARSGYNVMFFLVYFYVVMQNHKGTI